MSDVFFSYRRIDWDRAAPIVAALEARGLDVWVDKDRSEAFTDVSETVRRGLGESKALLAFYSKDYPNSFACRWELTQALLAEQRCNGGPSRVLVINPEPDKRHIVDATTLYFGVDDPGAVAAAVSKHIARLRDPIGELGAAQTRWYGRAGLGSRRFIGRRKELWKLHAQLTVTLHPMEQGAAGPSVALVSGLAGVGKSLLAEEYGRLFAAAYPGGVFWLNALAPNDPSDQMRAFARELGLRADEMKPEELRPAVGNAIEKRNETALWIVDDLPSGLSREEMEAWIAPHPLARTLFTTRSREYGGVVEELELDVLDPEEAYTLLTTGRKPKGPEEEAAARGLVANLGRHSLAMDVAGATLAASALMSFAEYRDEIANLSTMDELAVDLKVLLPNDREKSIVRTLAGAIDRVGDEARDFLTLASMLAVEPIPVRLVAAVLDKRRADKGIREADLYSLAEKGAAEDERRVHALVSRVMRLRNEPRAEEIRKAAVRALGSILRKPVHDVRHHSEVEREVAHARELAGVVRDLGDSLLLHHIGWYDYQKGAYLRAKAAWTDGLRLCQTLLGEEHPNTLTAMNNLALTLRKQGDLAGARSLFEKVLEVRNRVLGEEHPHTLTSMSDLAGTLQAQGDLAGARSLFEKVYKVSPRALGEEHRDTLRSIGHMAEILQAQGDRASARALFEKVLELRRRVLGDEHPHTLGSLNNLALTLQAQGHPVAARALHEQALDSRQRVLGVRHPNTSNSAWNLFQTCEKLHDSDACNRIVDLHLRWLVDADPDSLGALQRKIRSRLRKRLGL